MILGGSSPPKDDSQHHVLVLRHLFREKGASLSVQEERTETQTRLRKEKKRGPSGLSFFFSPSFLSF